MKIAVLILFVSAIGIIFLYSLVQLSLILNYIKAKKKNTHKAILKLPAQLPFVTIQLPLYNELYVVERLIDAVCEINYPKDKLEIQVLDDSTDESFDLATKKVAFYAALGINIIHISRKDRTGYKAGALKNGLSQCNSEFVAIFDADFIPNPNFLTDTLPYFIDEKIGLVQTKWTYLNENYSYLTKLQAFGLNAHFSIEQVGRNIGNHFINFNGTAGIWRKNCIESAGGWEADTLTEDLDLSYRAQLKNWKFLYLEEIGSPSELPVEMNALKQQQYRWTKGAAECARKNLGKVIRSKELSFKTKVHATFHLMNSFVFVLVFLISLLALPVILIKTELQMFRNLYALLAFFMSSWLILGTFYWFAYRFSNDKKNISIRIFLWKFPLFLATSMGLSLHNSIAVIEGYLGKKTPFVRTPKFNISSVNQSWKTNIYTVKSITFLTVLEGVLLLYFIFTFIVALKLLDYTILPLILFLLIGYGIVFFNSIFHFEKRGKI